MAALTPPTPPPPPSSSTHHLFDVLLNEATPISALWRGETAAPLEPPGKQTLPLRGICLLHIEEKIKLI